MAWIVYWLFDTTCRYPKTDGYVGITTNLPERIKKHQKQRFANRAFKYCILFEGTEKQCVHLEMKLRPLAGIGWNLAPGGPDGYKRGMTEETRLKLRLPKITEDGRRRVSEARKNAPPISEETRRRLSESHKGHKHSDETKAKMSASQKMVPREKRLRSIQARLRISMAGKGRKHSEKTKLRMSKSQLQFYNDNPNRRRIGYHHSEETKALMRMKRLAYLAKCNIAKQSTV